MPFSNHSLGEGGACVSTLDGKEEVSHHWEDCHPNDGPASPADPSYDESTVREGSSPDGRDGSELDWETEDIMAMMSMRMGPTGITSFESAPSHSSFSAPLAGDSGAGPYATMQRADTYKTAEDDDIQALRMLRRLRRRPMPEKPQSPIYDEHPNRERKLDVHHTLLLTGAGLLLPLAFVGWSALGSRS